MKVKNQEVYFCYFKGFEFKNTLIAPNETRANEIIVIKINSPVNIVTKFGLPVLFKAVCA